MLSAALSAIAAVVLNKDLATQTIRLEEEREAVLIAVD